MFYFYAIYEDSADVDFWNIQRSTLLDWHYNDPVDDLEFARSEQEKVVKQVQQSTKKTAPKEEAKKDATKESPKKAPEKKESPKTEAKKK